MSSSPRPRNQFAAFRLSALAVAPPPFFLLLLCWKFKTFSLSSSSSSWKLCCQRTLMNGGQIEISQNSREGRRRVGLFFPFFARSRRRRKNIVFFRPSPPSIVLRRCCSRDRRKCFFLFSSHFSLPKDTFDAGRRGVEISVHFFSILPPSRAGENGARCNSRRFAHPCATEAIRRGGGVGTHLDTLGSTKAGGDAGGEGAG